MKLNPLQNDRAARVLIALAARDGLGASYEFGAEAARGSVVSRVTDVLAAVQQMLPERLRTLIIG